MLKNKNNPLISIILPVYNGQKFLDQAILSCLEQTYSNLELIIVNDASTDASLQIAEKFQELDGRIKIISNNSNFLLPASLNVGHIAAKGDFVTWTSDDNILKPDFLNSLYDALVYSNCDVVYSNYDIIWEDGNVKRTHTTGPLNKMLFGDFIGASFLYKMEVFKVVKGYDEDLFLVEDYHFFLKACIKFKFYHLHENLYQYRIHKESLTGKIQNDNAFKERHKQALMIMYKDIGKEVSLDPKTIKLIIDLYFNDPVSIQNYLDNYNIIKKDISNFESTIEGQKNDLSSIFYLQEAIRRNWLTFKKEQTPINLYKVILKQNGLLFSDKFNRNATLKLIYLCLT
tara:strand:+ start:1174 stop:2202 length:1029 start_codon:yes stop_codon:yes gene_type:complete